MRVKVVVSRPAPARRAEGSGPGTARVAAFLLLAAPLGPGRVDAQPVSAPATGPATGFGLATGTATLTTLGSPADERARLGQLLGGDSTAGFLLRTPTVAGLRAPSRGRVDAAVLLPEALVTYNSDIPTADNDGALWAGRGTSVLVRAGVVVRTGRVTFVLAPEVFAAANRPFASQPAFLGGQQPYTGPFAAQWFIGPYSADLPIRFGDQSYTIVGAGQSALSVAAGPVRFGASTENQWWGPGLRNALLMSNAAEGVPHLFLQTARPLRTRIGDVEARWIFGTPTGSLYFDAVGFPAPDGRTLSGGVAALRVRGLQGLSVGVARLVLRPSRGGFALGRAFDVFVRNDNLGTGYELRTGLRSDQLTSLFARWVVPGARAEVYGEFARSELPRTVRDLFLAPLNTGAYTLGVAHAWPAPARGTFHATLELTNLEQTRTFTDRPPPPDYYTGRSAPRGFTSRGQPLGAAIGPGSQSQWAALDYYAPRWRLGAFAQRVRHQNDALYRAPVPNLFRHDVSLAGGLRAGARYAGVDARATASYERRLNFLFQNGTYNYLGVGSVDVNNLTFGLALSPVAPRPAR